MLGSESMLRFFDANGKGFDEMTGWYLCDGRNGSPDLRGRFVTGRHPDWSDYKVGLQGGSNHIQLSESQMPNHTHLGYSLLILLSSIKYLYLTFNYYLDKGHTHQINLDTNFSGDHTHDYMDVFFSDNPGFTADYVPVPHNIGLAADHNYNNVGHQFRRKTLNSGNHIHNIAGNSQISKANLMSAGGNELIDIRPLYTVVQYIIYISP